MALVAACVALIPAARADAYLHEAEATAWCFDWNFQSAEQLMLNAVGLWTYSDGWGRDHSSGFTRYSSDSVAVNVTYTSKPNSQYHIQYGCYVSGSDAAAHMDSIWQVTSVY